MKLKHRKFEWNARPPSQIEISKRISDAGPKLIRKYKEDGILTEVCT